MGGAVLRGVEVRGGYLSSLHDPLRFGVQVEIPPQGFLQNAGLHAHLLTVQVSELLSSTKKYQMNVTMQHTDRRTHL